MYSHFSVSTQLTPPRCGEAKLQKSLLECDPAAYRRLSLAPTQLSVSDLLHAHASHTLHNVLFLKDSMYGISLQKENILIK